MRNLRTSMIGCLISILCCFASTANAKAKESGNSSASRTETVKVMIDLVYGYGTVDISGKMRRRPMLLDAYIPIAPKDSARPTPAILLAFGGAFHRGSKGDFQFTEDGAQDSSMADYCMALAKNGIACFSVDYRLVPEDPLFPSDISPENLLPKAVLKNPDVTNRIELIRSRMGLPPLDDISREQLWNGTFAAVEDVERALEHVKENANQYNIDPDRIALGGFSAGAVTVINLAYGKGADVKAVVSLSGTSFGYDLNRTLTREAPPILLFVGQWDLPGIIQGSSAMAKLFNSHGIVAKESWVPGFGHFYPMGSPSLGLGFSKVPVIDRIVDFLKDKLG